jgi:hypothetical protein
MLLSPLLDKQQFMFNNRPTSRYIQAARRTYWGANKSLARPTENYDETASRQGNKFRHSEETIVLLLSP